MEKSSSQPTHFINVDLDLESDTPLNPIFEFWGERVFVLHHDGTPERGWSCGLELAPEKRTAEEAIVTFVELVTELPTELRERWDSLTTRKLDVGVQAGAHPRSWNFAVTAETLARLGEIDAQLVCTVYATTEGTSTALPKQD